ncbi:MAG: ABC transporter ATP-binding protein [Bacteriovoracaceae bacterium]
MLVDLKNVNKVYGDTKETQTIALKAVNLQIAKGDFMAVIGPSGSGKTTLLNCLAGLVLPSTGEIHFAGKRIDQLSLEERTHHRLNSMGFVFQDYQLLPVLTAKENVELPLQLKGIDQKTINEYALQALDEVGILHLKDRFPKDMSGGQQQRVSIARSVVARPSLVLADEPTANLDSKTAQEVIDLFLRLNQKHQITFIFSTHDQRLMDHVKRIVKMQDGVIL